jgi:LPS sulfotransferase NodH
MDTSLSYLVCGVQRCGSTLLCEALAATGVAGVPREYFMPGVPGSGALDVGFAGFEQSPWAQEQGAASFPEFLAAALKAGRSANGVFAAKIQWNCFEPFLERLRVYTPYGGTATARQLVRRSFGKPRFIFLTRRDRVHQAVSWALAGQTGPYASAQAAERARLAGPHFNAELLDGLLRLIEAGEAGWESLFDVLDVEPLRLVYEDWCQDLPSAIKEIIQWLGLGGASEVFDSSALTFERQASALNDEWVARYREVRGLPA